MIKTWIKLGAPAENLEKVPAMLLGALNLTPMEVAQTFQTIGSLGNRAKLSALRSVINQDGTVLYQNYPQAETTVSPQAAYMTLFGMQQVVNSVHSSTSIKNLNLVNITLQVKPEPPTTYVIAGLRVLMVKKLLLHGWDVIIMAQLTTGIDRGIDRFIVII